MNFDRLQRSLLWRRGFVLAALLVSGALAAQGQRGSTTLVVTSTNDPNNNAVVVFELQPGGAPSLTLSQIVPTGGKGGASGNAGIVQFDGELGAVANYGSNSVIQLIRYGNGIVPGGTIRLAPDCEGPDSVALGQGHLYVVGKNCAESHTWPRGSLDGSVVSLADNSAAQIAVGRSWAAVTMTSGSVLHLPLAGDGGLSGASSAISLPAEANNTPLGEAFWGDVLGFTPAHSADSFAIVNAKQDVYPVVGPTPAYPTNAPCWVAKGAGNVWYTGNSPGQAISIFFSDADGGVFYKSVPVPGVPTDITVSPDGNWLAVIYTAADGAHVGVYSIDAYGGLTQAAVSPAIDVASFSGVAFSQ
ncbi:MAG TPA: hypothetical protein VL990_10955 [Acidobacteriaceae bacterium]|nr:hypothetical protein [Acidobacteriaceae bacterium]